MPSTVSLLMLLATAATVVTSQEDSRLCIIRQTLCNAKKDSREQHKMDCAIGIKKLEANLADPSMAHKIIASKEYQDYKQSTDELEQYKYIVSVGKYARCSEEFTKCLFPDGVPSCYMYGPTPSTPKKINPKKKAPKAYPSCPIKRPKQQKCFRRTNFHR